MGYLLFKQRLGCPDSATTARSRRLHGCWHAGNLVITLRVCSVSRWRAGPCAAIREHDRGHKHYRLLLAPASRSHSFVGHRQSRELTRIERIRVYLSYIPCVFLVMVVRASGSALTSR